VLDVWGGAGLVVFEGCFRGTGDLIRVIPVISALLVAGRPLLYTVLAPVHHMFMAHMAHHHSFSLLSGYRHGHHNAREGSVYHLRKTVCKALPRPTRQRCPCPTYRAYVRDLWTRILIKELNVAPLPKALYSTTLTSALSYIQQLDPP
jgi:hypothetical protein